MSDGDAAWSGWGAPHPQAPATPFGVGVVFGGHPHGVATSTTATPTVSKNRARRQRRDLAGAARAPLRPARGAHESGAATDSDDGAGDDAAYAHAGPADALRPLASPLRQPMAAVVVDITRSSEKENQSNDRDHDHNRDHEDNDDDDKHGDAARDDPTERQPGGGRRRKGTVPSGRRVAATTNALDDATSTDDGGDSLGDLSEDDGDRRVAAQTKGSDDGRAMVVARASRRDHKSDTHEGGAVTRISARHRQKSSSPTSSIIVEGDVLSCRTCGAPSTARRSARMGVYVGDGWVVHAAQRRQRTTASSRSSARYDVVQQTLRDFADGRTLSADEWFRTRSEFPAAVRVRRALERVGAEWEVPEGLDDARASEDFALWAATGQSALTHADYRDDRDPPPGPSSSSSTSRRRDKERRDGVVARAVRLGSDSPPPVLARIHQPAAALSASPPTRPPAPPATDYRHVVAGGLVGLYLGGPVGGAVGGAAGLLLDSMASLGRAWRP